MENDMKVPQLPLRLKQAIQQKKLVVFLGAGVSKYAGLGDWNDLKYQLIDGCRANGIAQEIFRAELKAHSNYYECFQILKNHDRENYDRIIKKFLNPKDENRTIFKRLISFIQKLEPLSIVTLNVDPLLFEHAGENGDKVYLSDIKIIGECSPFEIKSKKIFYFHGIHDFSRDGKTSWVFNDFDLEERYSKTDSAPFLHALFSGNYTVLFLGFSFNDERLLKHARIPSALANEITEKQKDPLHYNLTPKKPNNKKIINQYFYGVETVEYELVSDDVNEYKNFEETLKAWAKEIENEQVLLDETAEIPEEGPRGN